MVLTFKYIFVDLKIMIWLNFFYQNNFNSLRDILKKKPQLKTPTIW